MQPKGLASYFFQFGLDPLMVRRAAEGFGIRFTCVGLLMFACLAGCAKVPLQSGASLSSYDNLVSEKSLLAKAAIKADRDALLSARTVRIIPTGFTPTAAAMVEDPKDLRLVANAIDRSLCVSLSDRLQVVGSGQAADLTVRANVTVLVPTNAAAAALSTATSLGTSVVLPVSVPRLPLGLGGLGVEAEAIGVDGKQKAAMVWARGANSITEKPRMSKVGDAYSLASKFGNDFAALIVKGKSPFGGMPEIPSLQKMRSGLGGKAKYTACETFGRAPGVAGLVTGQLGMPPGWSDKGDATARK
ncbi:hypothetical protein GCM10011491_39150 [Brucella endophytica]|uniref:DUF3313 domain-containing protein n=1 Tax=Brucella endophytica TaxID=1963359 RepID=A0A916WKS7_9HYPH|nr:DUF3313 domain-containing protein [Brucella endophytica]GGB07213.1 hypothetical protein GCM10011491_39150 [Brucella endophytica]